MICYPSPQKSIPLIIAGLPRSGTRFVTNVLNAVPGVTIQSEIPEPVITTIKNLIETCDAVYTPKNKKNWGECWDATKRDFMYSVWANLTKSTRRKSAAETLFYGYKTPGHEFYFDFYNHFFYPIQPKYVCCVRSFVDHFLSVQARWPKRDIRMVSKSYIQSLNQIACMKKQKPDHVILFVLDDYKTRGFQYLRDQVFEPLCLQDVAAAEKKASQGAVNTSLQHAVTRKEGLSTKQKVFLKLFPQPLQKFDELRMNYG